MTNPASAAGPIDPLGPIWQAGYSIPELWGFTPPVGRATSNVGGDHRLLWGILGIVEYQVDRGAGHRYLRDRLWAGDWAAIGFAERPTRAVRLEFVPRIENAKFGRKPSAVGNEILKYTEVRIVHARFLAEATR